MTISELAKKTGVSVKTIRFYSDKGIISEPSRAENGYRQYRDKHIEELQLICRARLAGFDLAECRELLMLSNNPQRRSAEVKEKAKIKLKEINVKLKELQEMKEILSELTEQCRGDEEAECPIIDGFCSHQSPFDTESH